MLEELYKKLKSLDKVEIQYLVLKLMQEDILKYQDITEIYVEWLKYKEKSIRKDRQDLQNHVLDIWLGKKQDIRKNLKKTMHYLIDGGWINYTHEKVDSK